MLELKDYIGIAKYDKRLLNYNISQKIITETEWQENMNSLEDLSDNVDKSSFLKIAGFNEDEESDV